MDSIVLVMHSITHNNNMQTVWFCFALLWLNYVLVDLCDPSPMYFFFFHGCQVLLQI